MVFTLWNSSTNTWTKSLPAQTSVHSVEEESDFDFETASDVEMEEYSNRQEFSNGLEEGPFVNGPEEQECGLTAVQSLNKVHVITFK